MDAQPPAAAAQQGGAFTRRQALDAGFTAAQVRHRLESGRWVALRRGICADRQAYDAADPTTRHRFQAAAAALALRGEVAVSHESAARLLGLPFLTPPGDEVVLTRCPRPRCTPARLSDVRVHAASLPDGHVLLREGLAMTSPARTLVDLARRLPFRDAVVVADAGLRDFRVPDDDLGRVLRDCWTWPGIRRAHRVVSVASPLSESALETLARLAFRDLGLPAPELQGQVGRFRVDFLWSRYRTIGEVDGLSKYTAPDVLRAEKLRQEYLADQGYEVVRATWSDVTRRPQVLGSRVRRAFARAERRTGVIEAAAGLAAGPS